MTQTIETITCSKCGETKPASEFYVVRGRHQKHCKACEIARSVESHRALAISETRTFGVEIEFFAPMTREQVARKLNAAGITCVAEHYNHTTRDHWKLVTDGSVYGMSGMCGMELVSPRLTGKAGLRQLKKALSVLNRIGCKVNRQCGVHVHHDASDLDFRGWKTLAATYVRYEDTIDTVHPRSRRADNNTFCRSNATRFYSTEATLERIERARNGQQIRGLFGTRYVKLNMTSYVKHGTVEFRQHAGSLSYDKIANWVSLTQGMVEASKARKVAAAESTLGNLLKFAGAKAKTRRFFTERARELQLAGA